MLGQLQAQNNALHFNGTDNVTINHGSNSLSGTFTIEFWANPSSLSGQGFIGSRGPSDASFDIQLTGTGGLHGDIGNGSSWLTTSADAPNAGLQVGVWSHIAYVITPTGYTIYVNAVQKASGTYSGTPLAFDNNHVLNLGNYGINWGNGTYNGAMDELRIWSTARTQTEIQDNMNVELSSGTGLVVAYHFNQGVAGGNNSGVTTLIDATGTYNGTLNTFALSGSTSNWVSGANALPVELTYFSAIARENYVALQWQTASESNNQGFEIQHSTDGRNWQSIDFVAGSGTTTETLDYSYLHTNPSSKNNYYRLRQIDFDGREEFSRTVFVLIKNARTMTRIFPAVTDGLVYIEKGGEMDLKAAVFNANGQLLIDVKNTDRVDFTNMEPGIYFLIVKSGTEVVTERILKK